MFRDTQALRFHFKLSNIVYYQKHRTKNVKTYKKNMLKVCGTKSGRYCTDLDAYISKKQKVPVNAKYYRNEIMSSRCLLFIYLSLHTDYISAFTC